MPRQEIKQPDSHGDGEHIDPWLSRRLRAWHQVVGLFKGPTPVEESESPNPYASILEGRKKIDPVAFAKDFKKSTRFKEIDADLVVVEDPVGFTRVLPNGDEENYMDKLAQERTRGQNEAASYGIGTLGKQKFVEIIFNWDFLAATSGAVVGEKIMRAMKLATKENLPVVVLYSSGGQRQQEGAGALIEMLRTTYAIDQFKKRTNQPITSVLVGNAWGGISASDVPLGDLVIGMVGSDSGFAGGVVIKEDEGEAPPPGSQTVENSFLTNRNVHMVLNNQDELLEVLDKTFSILSEEEQSNPKPKKIKETTGIDFEGNGFKTPLSPKGLHRSHQRAKVPLPFEPTKPKNTYEQHYGVLRADPRRPDTLYILKHGFNGFVPYFSGRITEEESGRKYLKYPAIVAALAYIDDPRLSKRLKTMVIGNQPGYVRFEDGNIRKDHASPTAWDYRYLLKMLDYAKRLGITVTTITDTFGAKASLKEELAGQYEAISTCLLAQLNYPYLTKGYIIGVLGSGGGLATTFRSDYVAQFSGAQEYVAEPRSSSAILYRAPTAEDIARTIEGMKPTAEFSLSRGLIDHIIYEPTGGAQSKPLAATLLLREDMILRELEFGGLITEKLLERRGQRMENLRPIPIGYLPKSRGIRLAVRKLLHH